MKMEDKVALYAYNHTFLVIAKADVMMEYDAYVYYGSQYFYKNNNPFYKNCYNLFELD